MIELELDALARVMGGESSTTTVRVGGARYSSSQTDYGKCVDTVTDMTRQQHPDTRLFGIFGTDRNAGRRATATLRNMQQVCGTPSSG